MTENSDAAIVAHLAKIIQEGNCVLFLGAGASMKSGAPSGKGLSKLLGERFLPEEAQSDDLMATVEAVDTLRSRQAVNDFLLDILGKLKPAGGLLEIPTYRWHSIYTMNVDTLLEQSYAQCANPRQRVKPIYSNRDRISNRTDDEVLLYKLHGSINRSNHRDGRLALTIDDLLEAELEREKLFARLYEDLDEHPIVYVGFARNDVDFRKIVSDVQRSAVDQSEVQRGYAVQPSVNEVDRKVWEAKKITLIAQTAEEFFGGLANELPEWSRYAPIEVGKTQTHPLQELHPNVSDSLIEYLSENFEFIDKRIEKIAPNTEEFFLGAQPNWAILANSVDADRDLKDEILSDCLHDRALEIHDTHVVLIHAEAGAGKTTLLRRVAYELATIWDQVVVSLKSFKTIDFLNLERLTREADCRVFVVVDEANEDLLQLSRTITSSRKAKSRITFLLAARTNEWREIHQDFDLSPLTEYEMRRLSRPEIERILDKLSETGHLGTLTGATREVQVRAFEQRASKQLLVALLEATAGKSFEAIIIDEFDGIPTEEGKQAYLLVSSLHRFGIYTRAGLLSRFLKMPIRELGYSVLAPTEKIIVSTQPLDDRDLYYTTRHPLIANIVIDRKLPSDRRRHDFYRKVITNLDLGYSSDADAHRRLTRRNNRDLLRDFDNMADRRDLMNQLVKLDPGDAYAFQHAAIMELDRKNLDEAVPHLSKAIEMSPHDVSIRDTEGRYYLLLADEQQNILVAEEYLAKAEETFKRNIKRESDQPFGYSHLADTYLSWSRRSRNEDERLRYIGLAHEALSTGVSRCASSTVLQQKQAQIEADLFSNLGRAREILVALISEHPGDIATIKFAASLEERYGDEKASLSLLLSALEYSSLDPELHHRVANLMARDGGFDQDKVLGHFDASMLGSIRDIKPRIAYGAYLFSVGRYDESSARFRELDQINVSKSVASRLYDFDYGGLAERKSGKVLRLEHSSGWIEYDLGATSIFFQPRSTKKSLRDSLQVGMTVEFRISFNIRGAIARELSVTSTELAGTRQARLPL